MEDEYYKYLLTKIEGMDKKDKTGMSFVDVFKSYYNLYNCVMMKIGLMSDLDGIEAEKLLYGRTKD